MGFRLEITFNRLPEMGPAVRKACSDVVRKAVFDVEADAKVRAPVDTGALKASIAGKMIAPLTGEIVCGVEYGIYQELGTHKMSAQPFLTPAVEAVKGPFIQAIAATATRTLKGG